MTAPFPTRKQEEWRYADLDALQPVWEQFAGPVTLTVGAGESFEEVWLPSADDVQVRRVQIALEQGAKARLFLLNTAPVYGRIELDVSLAQGADFELFGVNIGTGVSTNEIVTAVRHIGENGRSRQVVRSVLNGKATGSYLGKVEVARGAQKTDAEQSVKAMLLDRGASANCKPELEIFADDVKCAHGACGGVEDDRRTGERPDLHPRRDGGDQSRRADVAEGRPQPRAAVAARASQQHRPVAARRL